MLKKYLLHLFLLLPALAAIQDSCGSTQQAKYSFDQDHNPVSSIYPLGRLGKGSTISVQFSLLDSGVGVDTSTANLIILIAGSNKNAQNQSLNSEASGCTVGATSCLQNVIIQKSDAYSLSITSTRDLRGLSFIKYNLLVKQKKRILLSLTDVLRSAITKVLYIQEQSQAQITLYPINRLGTYPPSIQLYEFSQNGEDAQPSLFKIDSQINLTSTHSSGVIKYNPVLSAGYYVLYITPTDQNISFYYSYTSNSYLCPIKAFGANWIDYFYIFQGCLKQITTKQTPTPCISFDPKAKLCITCMEGYKLLEGHCYAQFGCQARQYSHYGECYDVNSACDDYDCISGWCLTCVNQNYTLIDGVCSNPQIICQAGQKLVGDYCINITQHCLSYSNTTGNCISCRQNYQLNGSECQPTLICKQQEYILNQTCVPVPNECQKFDKQYNLCSRCSFGYFLSNGSCNKVACPEGQVLSNQGDHCVDVTELCATHDPVTGNCLTCQNSDYTVSGNGTCLRVISPIAGCRDRQRLGFGQCQDPQENCQVYDLVAGDCSQCLSGFYKNYEGRCTQSTKCTNETQSVNNLCLRLPENCLNADALARCTLCVNGTYRLIAGQCFYSQTCGGRQYLSNSGQCIDVNQNCDDFNPSSGGCITCKIRNTFPHGGICCPTGKIYNGEGCGVISKYVGRDSDHCSNRHPSTQYCLKCSSGYRLNYGNLDDCTPE